MFYAQRKEDIKLIDLFGGDSKRDGFYIDVGAWEPTLDSVTKHFYDRGWSGINIEPNPTYFAKLQAERPLDINLEAAASDSCGIKSFYAMQGSGLSTFVKEYADKFAAQYPAETIQVTALTLKRVCEIYVPKGTEIDFLKIDVEGHEREVIAGADWANYRPRILCIEATEPGTDTPAWDGWDYLVIAAGYDFIEFDGLNRWYRRNDQSS
jgi:FkbM family methyltransferase